MEATEAPAIPIRGISKKLRPTFKANPIAEAADITRGGAIRISMSRAGPSTARPTTAGISSTKGNTLARQAEP